MTVKLWPVCAAFLGLLCVLSVPASAQVLVDGDVSSTSFTTTLGAPEGGKLYLIALDASFSRSAHDGDPANNAAQRTIQNFSPQVEYVWPGADKTYNNSPIGRGLQENQVPTYNGSTDGYAVHIDLSPDADRALSDQAQVEIQDRSNAGTFTNTTATAPYTLGRTTVQVNDLNGKPISGASVKMLSLAGYQRNVDEVATATTDNSGSVSFGYTPAGHTSAPYPPGMASERYIVQVDAAGLPEFFKVVGIGTALKDQTVNVNLLASGDTFTMDATPPPVVPVTTGGSGGSLFDPATLFTLDPADLDALKKAASDIFNYGPLGVPAAVIAAFNTAFSGTNTSTSAAAGPSDYWTFYLSARDDHPETRDPGNNTASLPAVPAGYNDAWTHIPGHVPTIYDGMFPRSLDLLPYAGDILIGRRLALVALWLTVSLGLLHRFTPQLRI